jgi:hypothetical protein
VGSDISELRIEARNRAYREHARFLNNSSEERVSELAYLSSMKQVLRETESKIKDEASREEEAIAEVPERAQIHELRSEFPHIQFSFK